METKQITNYRRRILKALNSLSCMGDMLLTFEVDGMSQADRLTLQAALLKSRSPLTYPYLDETILKHDLKTKELI